METILAILAMVGIWFILMDWAAELDESDR